MTVSASGAAASCLAVQQRQDGSQVLVLTALPSTRNLALDLVEMQDGYTNSPRTTSFNLLYDGLGQSPIYGDVALLDARTVTPTRGQTSAPVWQQIFDPSNRQRFAIDLSAWLGATEGLADLIGIKVGAVGALLGLSVESGATGPRVDRTNKRISARFAVADQFQGAAYFTSLVLVPISFQFLTAATAFEPPQTYELSGMLKVQQS